MYTLEDMIKLFKKMENTLYIKSSISFMTGNKSKIPKIRYEYDGDTEYYDSQENVIVFGIPGIYKIFKPKDDEEALMAYDFVSGHEEQHFRSTADFPYEWGITQATKEFIAYAYEKATGKKKRFRSNAEVEECAKELREKYDLYINFHVVQEYIAHIQNSLCDGRIERIRSYKNSQFSGLRSFWRHRKWKESNLNITSKELDSASAKLNLITNNILMLATSYYYEKGFYVTCCENKEIMDYMDSILPHLQNAVLSSSTRGMATESIEIIKILSPLIYETAKIPDALVNLLKKIQELAEKGIGMPMNASGSPDNSDGSSGSGLKVRILREEDEETEDGSEDMSESDYDLFVVVKKESSGKSKKSGSEKDSDDSKDSKQSEKEKKANPEKSGKKSGDSDDEDGQEPDEDAKCGKGKKGRGGKGDISALEEDDPEPSENDTDKSSSSNGPKEDADKSNTHDEKGNSGETSDDSSEDTQEGDENSSSASDSMDDKEGDSESTSEDGSQNEEGTEENSKENSSSDANQDDFAQDSSLDTSDSESGSDESLDDLEQDSSSDTLDNENDPKNNESSNSKSASNLTDNKDEALDTIEKAMKEAAQKMHDRYENFISAAEENQRKQRTAEKKKDRQEKNAKADKPVDNDEMSKLINNSFEEVKRCYKLTDPLPPQLAANGRLLHRQNQKYFKSLSIPDIRYLDKGSVDPSRAYGLACGDYDIYKRNGTPRINEYAAYVLIDNSGSMAGNKRTKACLAAALIEEGFRDLMPVKICAFDECGIVVHELIKDWNESHRLNCCYNYLEHGRSGYGNEDQYDIMIATEELMRRPERKKLLCYLSDGAPASISATRKAVEAARKKGIQVCGIYFEEDLSDTRDFIKIMQKDYICCEPAEISKNLQMIFKRFSRS